MVGIRWIIVGTRVIVSALVIALVITILGRMLSDFDAPAVNDSHDIVRGIGVWVTAFLTAIFAEWQLARSRNTAKN